MIEKNILQIPEDLLENYNTAKGVRLNTISLANIDITDIVHHAKIALGYFYKGGSLHTRLNILIDDGTEDYKKQKCGAVLIKDDPFFKRVRYYQVDDDGDNVFAMSGAGGVLGVMEITLWRIKVRIENNKVIHKLKERRRKRRALVATTQIKFPFADETK